jgi:hypothetical protein
VFLGAMLDDTVAFCKLDRIHCVDGTLNSQQMPKTKPLALSSKVRLISQLWIGDVIAPALASPPQKVDGEARWP